MLRSALIAGLALSWPIAMAPWVEPVLERAERWGHLLGNAMPSRSENPPPTLAPPSASEQVVPLSPSELESESTGAAPTQKAKRKSTKRTEAPLPKPKHGIRVGEASVLRLARGRAVPSSHFVAATDTRPSGLALSGVSGLGIGMQEGDVLTHVAGVPVRDRGQVVNLVLQARARRASQISARFHRGSEPWMLVVDLPYPEPNSAPADPQQ